MKKNRYLFLLTAALLVSMAGGTLTSRAAVGTINHTAIYEGTPLIGTDTLGGVTYTTFTYGDLLNGGEPGKPFLPIDYIRFSVPYNATGFTVTTTARPSVTHNLSHLVYPSQAPRLMSDTTPVTIDLPDTAAYYSGGSYPSQLAWVVDEGFLDGENHIVTVAVLPFIYSHTSTYDRIVHKQRVYIQLHYTLGDSLAMYPIVRNDSLLREEGHRMAQSMVVNPTQVKAFAPQAPASAGIESLGYINGGIGGDGLNGGGITPVFPPIDPPTPIDTTHISTEEQLSGNEQYYPYLIVTTSELKNSVRRIAALKRQKGYNVKVVTMDEVMHDTYSMNGDYVNGHYAYSDSAGVLRQYLRFHYRVHGTKYVLLVGKEIPYKYRQFIVANVPSDLYYSELNSDWSEAEIEKDPELYVGRITAMNEEQVMNYSDKLYRYELKPGKGDCNYLKSALYTEGHDMHRAKEVERLTQHSNSIFPDSCVMVEDTSGVRFPTGVDIINEINSHRYGYISLHNHGDPSGLITYGFRKDQNCPNDIFRYLWAIDTIRIINTGNNYNYDLPYGNGLNNLLNKWYPSICYSMGCNTMPFDKITNFENIPLNFGESFILGKDYGGPAFLGNTRSGYIRKSSQLEESFCEQISHNYYNIGKAEALSKLYFSNDVVTHTNGTDKKYFSCVHNLLGDPELEIWTELPSQYSEINISRIDSTISITGIDSVGSIVAYYNNNEKIIKQIASSSITLNHITANCSIMLYKHNRIPYIAPMELQNVTFNKSQYVIASDVTAGKAINSVRSKGDVIVSEGIKYEIEASGTVRLEDGFKVEKGATFAVSPACF